MESITRGLYETIFKIKKMSLKVNVRIVTHNEQLALDELLGGPNGEQKLTITELSQRFNASMPATSRLVKQLEDKGLAYRTTDTEDRRFTYVMATEKGKDSYIRNTALISDVLERAVEGLDPADVEHVLSIMSQICERAEAEIMAQDGGGEEDE